MAPTVSVMMPVYDSERYLQTSMESILSQTYRDFELVIVSEYDTSIESLRIIESYSDERIRHLHNDRKLGFVPSLNVALKEARGEYIARMDADDVSKHERFERQVDYLTKHQDVGVLGTAFETIDYEGKVIATHHPPTIPSLTKWSLLFGDEIAHSSVMVRHSLFNLHGPYNSQLQYGEDYELWLRLVQRTNIVNLPDTLVQRRLHDKQLTSLYYRIPAPETVATPSKAIAAILGREISLGVALALAKYSLVKANDAFQAATTLRELYFRFISQNHLQLSERESIRRDAALRMETLARVSARKNPLVSLKIWRLMSQFRPNQLPFSAFSALRRAVGYAWKHSLL